MIDTMARISPRYSQCFLSSLSSWQECCPWRGSFSIPTPRVQKRSNPAGQRHELASWHASGVVAGNPWHWRRQAAPTRGHGAAREEVHLLGSFERHHEGSGAVQVRGHLLGLRQPDVATLDTGFEHSWSGQHCFGETILHYFSVCFQTKASNLEKVSWKYEERVSVAAVTHHSPDPKIRITEQTHGETKTY